LLNRSAMLYKGEYHKDMEDLKTRKEILEESFNSRSDTRKKAGGTFFTPFKTAHLLFNDFLVNFLDDFINSPKNQDNFIKVINELSELKLLEPCFGNGHFLNAAVSSLCQLYEKIQAEILKDEQLSDLKDIRVKHFLDNKPLFILKYNIRGIEIDPLLFELGLINTSLFSGMNIFKEKEILANFINDDFFNFCSSLKLEKGSDGFFDIVFGNPPWGIDLDCRDAGLISSRLKSVSGIKNKEAKDDSFVFFTIKAIEILKTGGRIGFIIPNFFLTNPSYTAFRKFLTSRYRISNVVNLHEDLFDNVTMSSCFFTLDRIKPSKKDIIQVLQQQTHSGYSQEPMLRLLQSEVQEARLSRIPLVKNALGNENNFKYKFGDFLRNGRGIEIGKKGLVTVCPECESNKPMPKKYKSSFRCEQCGHFFDPVNHSRNIIVKSSDRKADLEYHPLVTGAQIKKYSISNPFTYYIETGVKGIKYKPYLLKAPKILIRKTGKGINAVVDTSGFFTVQVVYVLFFPGFKHVYEGLSLDYLCALLNSSFMTDYYFSTFSDPNKTRFPHLIQRNLLDLPIPVSPPELIAKIDLLSKKLGKKSELINNSDLLKIDTIINDLFRRKKLKNSQYKRE